MNNHRQPTPLALQVLLVVFGAAVTFGLQALVDTTTAAPPAVPAGPKIERSVGRRLRVALVDDGKAAGAFNPGAYVLAVDDGGGRWLCYRDAAEVVSAPRLSAGDVAIFPAAVCHAVQTGGR